MSDIERMWENQKIGKMILEPSTSKHPEPGATWSDPVFSEGRWGLHTVRRGTLTQRVGWQSIISHDCDLNGSPCWMLIEYHSRKTTCMYCDEDMPPSIVAMFKFHNEDMIQ